VNIEPIWIISQTVAIGGATLWAYIQMVQRVRAIESNIPENTRERLTKLEATVHTDLHERVIALEAVLDMIGKKAAKMLHSPHDPWGIDHFLDEYIAHDHDLSDARWREFHAKCEELQKLDHAAIDVRVLAMLVQSLSKFGRELAEHKLKRSQLNT
jgi:hypothetical protein